MSEYHQSLGELVRPLIESFKPLDSRELKLVGAVVWLVGKQTIDANGRLHGPKISYSSIARRAELSRELISHEGCALSGARLLIRQVLEALSCFSLEIQCECLRAEVVHLRARVDRQDSIIANKVVAQYRNTSLVESTPQGRYNISEVRKSIRIIPMDEL